MNDPFESVNTHLSTFLQLSTEIPDQLTSTTTGYDVEIIVAILVPSGLHAAYIQSVLLDVYVRSRSGLEDRD